MKKLIYEKYTVREKRTAPQPHGPDYVYYVDVEKRRNPQLRDVTAIYSHGKSCVAHYRHGKKVWPEDETLKNSIIVELPEQGSLDWAYWVHALARVEERGYSKNNYVRIKIGEEYYYVGAAPAGQKALQVRGGQFYYSDGRAVPQVTVGQYLQVEAKVQKSLPYFGGTPEWNQLPYVLSPQKFDVNCRNRTQAFDEGYRFYNHGYYFRPRIKRYLINYLPLLPHDVFHVRVSKGGKEKNGMVDIQIYSMPSNTLVACIEYFVCGGERNDRGVDPAFTRKAFRRGVSAGYVKWEPQTGGNIVEGDTYWRIAMYYDYNGGVNDCHVGFRRDTKAFTRTWQMPVTLTT